MFITGVVPFRQISSLVLDFYQVMARLRCPCTLPWVSHAPISTQDLVPARDDVADVRAVSPSLQDSNPVFLCFTSLSMCYPGAEAPGERKWGQHGGGKVLPGWCLGSGGGRKVVVGGSDALQSCPGCSPHLSFRVLINVEKPAAKSVPLPPLSHETGSISWDYTQHLKENIYRIYIHIPFALFSGGSPVPFLPPAPTSSPPCLLPLAFTPPILLQYPPL